ncbi:MAG: phosphatidylserine decarboxylase [Alphaproteobacteria bacterium]
MRIPVTRYGMPEVGYISAAVVILTAVSGLVWPEVGLWLPMVVLVVTLTPLAFFRDPARMVPSDKDILVAPADGKITDVTEVDEAEFLHGPAVRIGIFLSVFDVHLNRSPCAGKVAYIQDHPGKCINAMRSERASAENEANCVGLICPERPAEKVMVKQITGAIARRIVCDCRLDEQLEAGQRFGMIKFGSRTELFVPVDERVEVVVGVGDTVRAGSTVLVRYRSPTGSAK